MKINIIGMQYTGAEAINKVPNRTRDVVTSDGDTLHFNYVLGDLVTVKETIAKALDTFHLMYEMITKHGGKIKDANFQDWIDVSSDYIKLNNEMTVLRALSMIPEYQYKEPEPIIVIDTPVIVKRTWFQYFKYLIGWSK